MHCSLDRNIAHLYKEDWEAGSWNSENRLRSGRVTCSGKVPGWGTYSTLRDLKSHTQPFSNRLDTQASIEATMKSLIHRSRAVRPPRSMATITTSTIPRPRTIPHLVRTYHASASTTTIDPSTFPITRGYTPPKDGRPQFKKILIANRYMLCFHVSLKSWWVGER